MSHHLDSPRARQDIRLDIADLYVLRGETGITGFAARNGRLRTDNAPDVMFSIAADTPVRLGIGKDSVTAKPPKTFLCMPLAAPDIPLAA